MINAAANKPYSADVQLVLRVQGVDYELAKVGANRIVLRTPVSLPPCDGTLTIRIDEQTTQQTVRLLNGASLDSPIVETSR